MSQSVHVEALLHLSALSLAVTVAYLGLDRVHMEKDAFIEALKKAQVKARDFVSRYEVGEKALEDGPMFYRFPFWIKLKFYTLCHVAEADVQMGWFRPLHVCHRQAYVPLLRYFKGREKNGKNADRRDRKCVAICGAILALLFLYLTAAGLWELQWFPANFDYLRWSQIDWVLTISFWMCAVVLFWIFSTVGLTYLLQNIDSICDRLEKSIEDRMRLLTRDATIHRLNTTNSNSQSSN